MPTNHVAMRGTLIALTATTLALLLWAGLSTGALSALLRHLAPLWQAW